jgi:hypothetical protein
MFGIVARSAPRDPRELHSRAATRPVTRCRLRDRYAELHLRLGVGEPVIPDVRWSGRRRTAFSKETATACGSARPSCRPAEPPGSSPGCSAPAARRLRHVDPLLVHHPSSRTRYEKWVTPMPSTTEIGPSSWTGVTPRGAEERRCRRRGSPPPGRRRSRPARRPGNLDPASGRRIRGRFTPARPETLTGPYRRQFDRIGSWWNGQHPAMWQNSLHRILAGRQG